jgi:hypothetical protein
MPRIVLSLAAWRAVAHELTAVHTASAPPGLVERIQALLAQSPDEWPEQACALELDESSTEAVRAIQARLSGEHPDAEQRAASVAEAIQIIHDHQRRG